MGSSDKRTKSCCRFTAMRSPALFCFFAIAFLLIGIASAGFALQKTFTGTHREPIHREDATGPTAYSQGKRPCQNTGASASCTAGARGAGAWGSAPAWRGPGRITWGRPRSASGDFPDSRCNFCRYLNKFNGLRASRQNAWLEAK